MAVTYVTDEAGLAEISGWSGIVGKDLSRRGRTLEYRAKSTVGVRTGRLRADIKTDRKTVVDGIEIEVGASTKYALMHHQGTRAHIIRPRSPSGFLRFEVAGKVVFARKVNHPGTRPNPYLTRWLREAVA